MVSPANSLHRYAAGGDPSCLVAFRTPRRGLGHERLRCRLTALGILVNAGVLRRADPELLVNAGVHGRARKPVTSPGRRGLRLWRLRCRSSPRRRLRSWLIGDYVPLLATGKPEGDRQ